MKRSRKNYTTLRDNCLVELISGEDDLTPEFKVSFRKKPLIHKCFIGQLILRFDYNEPELRLDILNKGESLEADIQQLYKSISESEGEVVEAYQKELEKKNEEYKKLFPILKTVRNLNRRSTLKAKVENIRLRVTEVAEFDKESNSWVCICEPAELQHGATKRQRKMLQV